MAEKIVLEAEGPMNFSEFDAGAYSGNHDIPAIYIGGQIVAVGRGYWCGCTDDKDENHLRWRLEEGKRYRVTIEEVTEQLANKQDSMQYDKDIQQIAKGLSKDRFLVEELRNEMHISILNMREGYDKQQYLDTARLTALEYLKYAGKRGVRNG